ncbi:MAG: (2Fe-2S)-binding protein [Marinicaulis sp.]|nr:(2Fe-2S)-binding protein [Marinicaulis sp.]
MTIIINWINVLSISGLSASGREFGRNMYVCICNALRDKELAEAASGDQISVHDVFRKCGTRPKCGKCVPDVAELIEQNRNASSNLSAIAAE